LRKNGSNLDALGKRLVRSLLNEKEPAKLTYAGISDADISDDATKAYDWSLDFLHTHKVWPTAKQVEENTKITLPEPPDDLEYICDLVRKRTLGKGIESDLKGALKQLEMRDPDEALKLIGEIALKRKTGAGRQVRHFREGGPTRYEEYQKLQSTGLSGLTTPWPRLNREIQGWVNGTLNVIVAMQNTGKPIRRDEPVLTPTGYMPIGELRRGDKVIAVDGTPTQVTGTWDKGNQPMVRLHFTDRTHVDCAEDHLWEVYHDQRSGIKTGKELLSYYSKKRSRRWMLPTPEPAQLESQPITIHPYLLGQLLGDGHIGLSHVEFTSGDPETFSYLEMNCFQFVKWGKDHHKSENCQSRCIIRKPLFSDNILMRQLRKLGLTGKTSHTKFIPENYLLNSVEIRLEVLRGLLDSDGSTDKRGVIEYSSESPELRKGVTFLVHSLGGSVTKGKRNGRMLLKLPRGTNPFRLTRKAQKWKNASKIREPRKVIKAVTRIDDADCCCISVDHPRRLFVLKNGVVTHNTWACCLFADHALAQGKRVLFVSMEMSTVRIERRVDAMHYKIPFGDLRDTEIDLFRELRWKQELADNIAGRGDIIYADKQLVRYVSDVNALVLEHEPDLVVVDGGYRFTSRQGKGDWESSKQVVNDLQTTAESTDRPWIVTTQQGEVQQKTRMDSQERAFKVKYAKEWVINPDIVIEMQCNDDLRLLKAMEWRLLKDRDAKDDQKREPFQTWWDLTDMRFEQLTLADDIQDGFASVSVVY